MNKMIGRKIWVSFGSGFLKAKIVAEDGKGGYLWVATGFFASGINDTLDGRRWFYR